jgi:hypothetical protein
MVAVREHREEEGSCEAYSTFRIVSLEANLNPPAHSTVAQVPAYNASYEQAKPWAKPFSFYYYFIFVINLITSYNAYNSYIVTLINLIFLQRIF